MQRAKQGFTLIELMVVVAIIAVLGTLGMVGYGAMSTRAKNSSIVHSVQGTIKAIELYQKKYGTYPLRQYANRKFADAAWDKTGTNVVSEISLILNDPDTIRTLQQHAVKAGRLAGRVTQNDHIEETQNSYRLRHAYLNWYPQYLDTVNRSTVTRSNEQKIRNGSTDESKWNAYANYLESLFRGIDLPTIYTESSSHFRAAESGGSSSDITLMGAEYSLAYGTQHGKATAFLTYALFGNTPCQAAGVELHKQKYLAESDATICSLKIGEEQSRPEDRGDD
ncbi:MAG: type II secretion system protein [Candidatus Saccharibacteria bacterium]|nr:type II secretion system protein [Candidatus Saccharibacteria bacterium]